MTIYTPCSFGFYQTLVGFYSQTQLLQCSLQTICITLYSDFHLTYESNFSKIATQLFEIKSRSPTIGMTSIMLSRWIKSLLLTSCIRKKQETLAGEVVFLLHNGGINFAREKAGAVVFNSPRWARGVWIRRAGLERWFRGVRVVSDPSQILRDKGWRRWR